MKGTEVARLIRKELKGTFPKQKFTVRNRGGSMSDAIHVGWTDGVAHNKVKEKIRKFSKIDYDDASGEILGGGNTFVFAERGYNQKTKDRVTKKIKKDYGWDGKDLDWERQQILQREVWNKLNKTSFK